MKSNNTYLGEAWLTIKWSLDEVAPGLKRDKNFQLAVLQFAESIKDKFPIRLEVNSDIPLDMLPTQILKYQFRKGKDEWPIIQFGPGIATLNYVDNYSWKDFQKRVGYLLKNLKLAYGDDKLKLELISLRYRNVIPLEKSSNNLLNFIEAKLNSKIILPEAILGNRKITNLNFSTALEMSEIKGQGLLTIATGEERKPNFQKEILVIDTELFSTDSELFDMYKDGALSKWMNDAHDIGKSWYFSISKDKNAKL